VSAAVKIAFAWIQFRFFELKMFEELYSYTAPELFNEEKFEVCQEN